MLIAITGGSGFVGRHLASALMAEGARVRVVDRAAPPPEPFPWGLKDVTGFEFVQSDVADRRSLDGAFSGAAAVVHMAAISTLRACRVEPLAAFRVNVLGTANVLDACAEASVGRVLTLSSRRVTQASAGGPPDVYAATKQIAETWTRAMGQVVVRLDNAFGPGQEEGAVVPDFIRRVLSGGHPYDPPRGEIVPLVYVTDAVGALVRLIAAGPDGAMFHVTAPEDVPLTAVADVLLALAAGHPVPPGQAGAQRAADPALAALGWSPRVSWAEGVRRTWQAWVERLAAPRAV